jgi:2-polyprenyl-3-methyl-5-hydroxy-6-metoxy-1,4-benzoquinol methylase
MKISKIIYFFVQLTASFFSFILKGASSDAIYHFPLTRNYIPIINNLIKGRKVLNLGCSETSAVFKVNQSQIPQKKYWFHEYLSNQADHVFGVDIDTLKINDMKKYGFNVEKFDLNSKIEINTKYDVVIAHHLVEHISNIKTFISNIKRCLNKDGVFIIKAFNGRGWAYDASVDLHDLNNTDYSNPKHVMTYAPIPFINMLNENGLSVKRGYFICSNRYCSIISFFNKTKADDFFLICEFTDDVR